MKASAPNARAASPRVDDVAAAKLGVGPDEERMSRTVARLDATEAARRRPRRASAGTGGGVAVVAEGGGGAGVGLAARGGGGGARVRHVATPSTSTGWFVGLE